MRERVSSVVQGFFGGTGAAGVTGAAGFAGGVAAAGLSVLGAGFATFVNLSVMRSLSPIAMYFSRSLSPSFNDGGSVQTPFG